VWGLAAHSKAVLKKVFGPKREELQEQWIKLHGEEIMLCTAHQKFLV
jgi:hypothetical protein